jgi:hypothetical protein
MRKASLIALAVVLLLSAATGCQGYTQTGAKSSSQQDRNGGRIREQIKKANGTGSQDIEVSGGGGLTLETDVTLTVETGSFTIELLGEDDEVTLVLQARDGETVSGHGQMVVDTFGEAGYRVTAVEAGNVDYSMEYTFR